MTRSCRTSPVTLGPRNVSTPGGAVTRGSWTGRWRSILLAGSANAFGDPAVLPASLVLAGAVAVRRRFPGAAYAAALAVGTAQVAAVIGPTFTGSPLQPTFADAGILILLYTIAADRSSRSRCWAWRRA